MLRARIVGTGSYAPKKVVTNGDLEAIVETTDAWIQSRTGIKERRISVAETSTAMAVKAAKAALKEASVSPKEIDLIIVGTVTPEMTFPSTACFVQTELGVRPGVAAFDVSAACSGFLYALDVADKYMRSGGVNKALVIGVDRFSRIVDWTDRSTCVLFGDGAGAVALSAEKGRRGVLASNIHSDGRKWEMLYAPGALRPSRFEDGKDARAPYLKMQGNETFKIAVRTMIDCINEALGPLGIKKEDVSLLIPHQANMRIIKAIRERMGISEDRVMMNLDRYGNTSAGSIPIALDEAVKDGRIEDNGIIVFVSFGGGLTWASSVVRW